MSADNSLVIVDTHVHIHDCFQLPAFFESASKNFEAVAASEGVPGGFAGALMLTEMAQANWFTRLVSFAGNDCVAGREVLGGWAIQTTGEPASVIARSKAGKQVFLMAGRQIVTKEKLEVLALATEKRFEDGLPIKNTLSAVNAAGAIAVIPWGFGKWWGRRGSIVNRLMKERANFGFFLGDNSGRPRLVPAPTQFKEAQAKGVQILPGSDPLPFASECWRPGSVGLMFRGTLSEVTPAADLKALLQSRLGAAKRYGDLEGSIRFVRNQCAMQLVKLIH